MFRQGFRSLLLATVVFASFAWLHAQAPARQPMLVFLHVTVINPGTQSVEQDQAVVIRQGRITAVASAAEFAAPEWATVVDASGKYMIPGLWDMHVHTAFGDWFPRGQEVILPLFIANGVTGVRDMGGDLPVLFKWRKEIAAGEIVGPRMVVSGLLLVQAQDYSYWLVAALCKNQNVVAVEQEAETHLAQV